MKRSILLVICILVIVGCGSKGRKAKDLNFDLSEWACVGGEVEAWRCYPGRYADLDPSLIPSREVSDAYGEDSAAVELAASNVSATESAFQAELTKEQDELTAGIESEADRVASGSGASAQTPPTSQSREAALATYEGNQKLISDAQALLEASDNSYVIQVIAASTFAEVTEYFAGHPEFKPDHRMIIKTRSNGDIWYVGILGPFLDYRAAQEMLSGLDSGADTWLRPVRGLKEAIAAAAD